MVPRVVDTAFLQHPPNPRPYSLSAFYQKLPRRRKVGDTLTATVTGAAAASYEWAVSVDGEDWEVVDTEDDETFGVTADFLGMYVKVTVTAEDGETASDVTTEAVVENEDYGKIEILSAEAVATNKVEVTLVNPVISTDTTIAITRGTTEITISKTSWESTFDKVTLTTDANMVPGEYTVTLTSEEDETNTDSDTFEVEAQEINIVILNETALTNVDEANPANSHKEAYAYYDVLDQYGESIRTSTSITWAGSCNITPDKATGRLTLEKSDGNAWVYGDKIYVTGVHTKTGASATAELSVGQEQALDSIEVAGFVKKNTTELKKTLPADFKTGEWYLLFNAYDQNGNLIQAGGLKDTDVSIISDNVLVVSAVKGVQNAPITIDDIEYNAIIVEPGIKVSDGGAVTLTAIALRTGTKTTYDCIVGVGTVITSFTMGTPAGIVADGDSVEIPYTALDEDGNSVTDFVTLAKNKTFNALSFSVGGNGALVLAEQEDGSAKLTYVDEYIPWEDSRSTDGIDRPVSLTAIVVGGETDNQLLSVQDKRRPDAIKEVDLDDVYVEGAEIGLSLGDISFYDQYNEVMDDEDAQDFFDTTTFTGGRDFAGYNFTVKATYSGNGGLYVGATHPFGGADLALTSGDGWMLDNGGAIADLGFEGLALNVDPTVYAKEDVTASVTNEGFKFEIVKVATAEIADPEKYETVSRSKSKLFTIVDIKAIKNFTVGDLGTLYVGAGAATGDGKIANASLATLTETDTPTAFAVTAAGRKGIGVTVANDYKKAVKLTGTYNGKSVTIPAQYYTATGNKVASSEVNDGIHTAVKLDTVIGYHADTAPNGLTLQDLYDKTTPLGVAQLGSDKIQATVWDIYGERLDGDSDTVADVVDDTEITTLKAADDTDLTVPTTPTAADLTEDIDWAAKTINEAITDIDARTAVLDGILDDSTAYETLGSGNDVDLSTEAEAAATAEKAELAALKTKLEASIAVNTVDTASTTVSLSDQKPTATSFENFDDAYTWSPVGTEYGAGTTLYTYIDAALLDSELAVLDQYGIDMGVTPDQIDKKASNIEENADGYVENNFTTTGNNTPDLTIVGAERGDTWTLTLSYDKLEQSSEITVGADAWATIVNADNKYLTAAFDDDGNQISGLQPKLENQRKAILDIA